MVVMPYTKMNVKSVIILITAVLLWLLLPLPLQQTYREEGFIDTEWLMTRHGYLVETHHVTTDDGYVLTLHRIPSKGRPVLLQHGILQSSANFVASEPRHALGLLLADGGYDVWIGNSRGNYYSNGHINANISREQYWDFSWHEMGVYDVPAVIDYILKETARDQLYYVGYSMGTSMFFVMTSSRPEYNSKVAAAVVLTPPVFVKNLISTLGYCIFVGSLKFKWLLDAVGIYQLLPRTHIVGWLASVMCGTGRVTSSICPGIYSLLGGGDNPGHMNTTLVAELYTHIPCGASIKTATHFGQTILSGSFSQYDYGSQNQMHYDKLTPPEYNLSQVTVPVTIFYGGADTIAVPQDVEMLYDKLTSSRSKKLILLPEYSHMDFVCATDANDRVYQHVVSFFDNS